MVLYALKTWLINELTKIHSELKKANNTLEQRVERRTKELKESNIKLSKTVMELDRFVYSSSHDLSATLKSVLGLVNIAKLEDKDHNLLVYLNYIEDSIKKQEVVIESLIQYSRNARQIINTKPLNLYELINQIIKELRYAPGAKCVNMINNLAKGVTINSDKQRMNMILNNLLSNAIKYRNGNKNDCFVKVDFTEHENSWQLIVEDNGQGIADDQQEKIFDMFHRANEEAIGSGLGLFIVKEAVERLGGNISVKSSLGQGSIIELKFPIL